MNFDVERERMVEEQLIGRGLVEPRLLAAFRNVPRHLFVPDTFQRQAYEDHPLLIGAGQTISQPYIAALMTASLRLQGHERVLEIGTGSGYQTALLAALALEVYSIERLPELLTTAASRLESLGYLNVQLAPGNGSLGWAEHAPYDAILVAASAPEVPAPLVEQLGEGGRLVIPIGPPEGQMLHEVEKRRGQLVQRAIAGCLFVPLIGRYGWPAASEPE